MIEALLVVFGLGGSYLTVAALAYWFGAWVGERRGRN